MLTHFPARRSRKRGPQLQRRRLSTKAAGCSGAEQPVREVGRAPSGSNATARTRGTRELSAAALGRQWAGLVVPDSAGAFVHI